MHVETSLKGLIYFTTFATIRYLSRPFARLREASRGFATLRDVSRRFAMFHDASRCFTTLCDCSRLLEGGGQKKKDREGPFAICKIFKNFQNPKKGPGRLAIAQEASGRRKLLRSFAMLRDFSGDASRS